ncbi:ndr family protein [Rhodococcus sp. MTM3W5.2]|uniref:alpha/beta fold hydrolase n=1 Tax=Rhodococcus sp. MTM3W5.2 TaxID=1805827 RepID=UPI00097949CF|nr:alpha/beta hydrolase [Rhodococcus sp. MTM3W5.2]AQA25716.1 ndr family protein [Rhodococcus sp. MTM3W5.2]
MSGPLALGVHVVDVLGVQQRYHVYGSGPVCLVHPGGPGLGWDYLRTPLLEAYCTVVYVEPIGTGESGRLSAPDLYTLHRYAEHLRAIVEVLDTDQAVLLGHAHGGSVVQQFMIDYPGAVAAAVLVSSSPVGSDELLREGADNLARFAEIHSVHSEAQDVTAAYLDILTATSDDGLTRAVRRLFPAYFRDYWDPRLNPALFQLRSSIRTWSEPARRGGFVRVDFRRTLSQQRTPALIIAGRWDPIVSARWSRMIQASMSDAELVELDSSAHMPHLEQPEEFARAVTDFVARTARR